MQSDAKSSELKAELARKRKKLEMMRINREQRGQAAIEVHRFRSGKCADSYRQHFLITLISKTWSIVSFVV